jgi:hypothetical protein
MVCYARSITATVAPTTDASIAFASPRAKKSSRNVIIQSMTQTASTQPSAKLLAAIGCGRCERARTRSARGLRPGFQLARSTQRPACPAFPETLLEAGFGTTIHGNLTSGRTFCTQLSYLIARAVDVRLGSTRIRRNAEIAQTQHSNANALRLQMHGSGWECAGNTATQQATGNKRE